MNAGLLLALALSGSAHAQLPPADTVVVRISAAENAAAFAAIAAAPPFGREIPTGIGGSESATSRYFVTSRRETGEAELHEGWIDIAFVERGAGVLRTGRALDHGRELEPGEWRGPAIVGARDQPVGPGDVLIIPAGMAHQYRPSGKEPLSYVTVKVPPPVPHAPSTPAPAQPRADAELRP